MGLGDPGGEDKGRKFGDEGGEESTGPKDGEEDGDEGKEALKDRDGEDGMMDGKKERCVCSQVNLYSAYHC